MWIDGCKTLSCHELNKRASFSKAKELFEDKQFFFWCRHGPAVQHLSTRKLDRNMGRISHRQFLQSANVDSSEGN